MPNPEVNHSCTPTCAICSGNHITGDRSCLKRLKPSRNQAAKPPKKPHKPAPRWFQSEEKESEWGVRTRSDPKEPFQNPHAVEKPCRRDRATRTAASKIDVDAESNLLAQYERASPSEKQVTGGMPCT
ncbi:hypothetical protein MTO96_044761 [Rhipicephalus appendiculatus]